VDLVIAVQTARSCQTAAERDPQFTPAGYCAPNHTHLMPGGIALLQARQRMAEILRILPGSSLVVAPSVETDRDRMRFFVGGGTLGPGAGGDSTFVDVIPSNTALNLGTGAAGGIYATQRIRSLSYTGGGVGCSVVAAASLYIDAAPTLVVASGQPYAIYVAGGLSHFVGNVESAAALTGVQVVSAGGAGQAFFAGGSGTRTVGFFGAGVGAGVAQQTGGAATAGATYTATEQGMINRMYSALRNYGLLS